MAVRTASKPKPRAATSSRKRLKQAATERGLAGAEIALPREHPDLSALVALVTKAGGAVIGAYRDPLGGRALLLATLPLRAVQPTPFQRDLSPTHTKRLAEKIRRGPLVAKEAVDIMLQLAHGLSEAPVAQLVVERPQHTRRAGGLDHHVDQQRALGAFGGRFAPHDLGVGEGARRGSVTHLDLDELLIDEGLPGRAGGHADTHAERVHVGDGHRTFGGTGAAQHESTPAHGHLGDGLGPGAHRTTSATWKPR